jgi:hypothetical protein
MAIHRKLLRINNCCLGFEISGRKYFEWLKAGKYKASPDFILAMPGRGARHCALVFV